jgi:hypothetical protein
VAENGRKHLKNIEERSGMALGQVRLRVFRESSERRTRKERWICCRFLRA